MKKVLLVTLWGYNNFGNRLQAIALKHMIEEYGYQVECLPNKYSGTVKYWLKKRIKFFLGIIGVSKYHYINLQNVRYKYLKKSSTQLLSPEKKILNIFKVSDKQILKKYVAAVVGSDQVWHKWTRVSNELDFYYLDFMPRSKRISYAASFGFENIPEEDKRQHFKGLSEMYAISCREKTGCELVKKNTSQVAELVLDPTLCVNREFWDRIEQKPDFLIKQKYIFVMLLGKKDSYYSKITEYARNNNLEVIDITDCKRTDIWKTTINGFIWLIHHAELICTDSFHCTVFSILYERPITVFRRKEHGFEHMFDRISTLLDLCGLKCCEYTDKIIDNTPDYKTAKVNLNPMIDKSKKWLRSTLKNAELQKGIQ